MIINGQPQDPSLKNNHWQYSSQGASPGTAYNGPNEYVSGQRISGMGSPITGLLPILILSGLGGIIVLIFLFSLINPMSLGGLFGNSYGGGQYPYGQKRSLSDQNKLQQSIKNIFNQVMSAVEKYDSTSSSSSPNLKAKSS